MSRTRTALLIVGLLLPSACRDEIHPTTHQPVEPPVASPNAIPDAPVSGTLRGAPFVLRDARYFVDRRTGYAHTDILLSAGKAESPCAPVSPATAASVWLRLDGPAKVETKDVRLKPGSQDPWSVHYQVFDGAAWAGVGEGSALLSIREPGADGRISGGLAICFSDDLKSCVSGSFDATSCPQAIDQPVRGTTPPEAIPEKYRQRMLDGGPTPSASADAGGQAARPR